MSTVAPPTPQGVLVSRRRDAVLDDGSPSAAVTVPPARPLRVPPVRVRYAVSRTFVWRVLSAIVAVLTVLALLAVTVLFALDTDSAVYYRAAALSLNGFVAVVALSGAADQQLFDLGSLVVFSVLALFVDIFLAIVELSRYFRCPNGSTQLDVATCDDSAPLAFIALGVLLLTLLQLVFAVLWYLRYRAQLRTIAKVRLYNAVRNGTVFKRSMNAQIECETRAALVRNAAPRSTASLVRRILAVILLVTVVFVVIIQLIYFRRGFFYRGALLLVSAHLAGAMYVYFGLTPRWWRWLTAFLAAGSLALSLWATIIEWSRYARCANNEPLFVQIESDICNQDGFLGIVPPIIATVYAVLSLASLVAVLFLREPRLASTTTPPVVATVGSSIGARERGRRRTAATRRRRR